MRALVIGGTRFIGRAITLELVAAGHEVSVVHRGEHEPDDLAAIAHHHGSRTDAAFLGEALAAAAPDTVIDVCAMTATDADVLLSVLPIDARLVAISSMDVYRAWSSVRGGVATDAVPLSEDAPLRDERYPYRGQEPDQHDYEKLDVEERYSTRQATICRLPMVYGPHDHSRREACVLDRVAAGRDRIPVGAGGWLWSKGFVGDLATGVRLAAESDAAVGQTFNLCETRTEPMRLWLQSILRACDSAAELVRVPDRSLPRDLWPTGSIAQPMLADPSKAISLLGWQPSDPETSLATSVAWHLANPAHDPTTDFSSDDRALATVDGRTSTT